MGSRGRRSSDDFDLPPSDPNDAPDWFTEEQEKLWDSIVEQHGAFDEDQLPLLEQFVTGTTTTRKLSQLISDLESKIEFDFAEYEKLLNRREKEARAVASYSVRLGIGRRASTRGSKKPQSSGPKPWE